MAAVATLWTTISFGMYRVGLGVTGDRPISYLGTVPAGAMLFRGGLAVATVLFIGFAFAVQRRMTRTTGFLAAFLVGMAGQAVVAAVSTAGNGTTHTVHATAGILLGLSLPVLMWRFAAGQPRGAWRRFSYALMWLEIAACVVGIVLSNRGLAALAEFAPAVVFHVWVVVVTVGWAAWSPAGVHRRYSGTAAVAPP